MQKLGFLENILLMGLACACGLAFAEPRWSMTKLDGVRSYRAGANCFNATLAAKGFTDRLRFSDPTELRYYLQRFCTKTAGLGSKGDVLAVVRNELLEHAAINLGNRIVFDKNSSAGGGAGAIDPDVRYGKRRMSESDWFADCQKPDCRVEAFKCESATKVRQVMARCSAKASEMGFDVLFHEFEFQTLNSKIREQISPRARTAYYNLIESLRTMNGNEECAPFILVQSLSIIINWNLLTQEGTRELNTVVREARDRVLRFDNSETTFRIIDESDWAPIWNLPVNRAQSLETNGK